MSVKCQGCGNLMYDDEKMCPFCRLPNPEYKEPTDGIKRDHTPNTINELKQWYIDRGLPPEQTTRFFIGRDIKEARAFGIYKDEVSGEYVVYKNKADGSRAVRYQGPDENYAVSELLARLKEEILYQKGITQRKQSAKSMGKSFGIFLAKIIALFLGFGLVFMMIATFIINRVSSRGYYKYNDTYYYHQNSSWYVYDDGWRYTTAPSYLEKNYRDYRTESFPYVDDFESSSYYEEPFTSSSSSSSYDYDDDDYDWGSYDSWDSGSTDWDSDW